MRDHAGGTEPTAKPAFDRRQLMEQTGDDLEFLQEILDVFLEAAPLQIEQLRESVVAGDPALVAKRSHSIKGAAAAAAAVTVQALALEIETASQTGDLSNAGPLTEKLASEFLRFQKEAAY